MILDAMDSLQRIGGTLVGNIIADVIQAVEDTIILAIDVMDRR